MVLKPAPLQVLLCLRLPCFISFWRAKCAALADDARVEPGLMRSASLVSITYCLNDFMEFVNIYTNWFFLMSRVYREYLKRVLG